MKKNLLFMLAALAALPASGQYDNVLADPTVSWAAEFEYLLNPDPEANRNDLYRFGTVLKLVNADPADPFAAPPTLIGQLFRMALDGRQPVYADPDLRQQLSRADLSATLSRIDTIISFDPENYEEKVMIVRNDLSPYDCPQLRVRQLLFYRDKSAEFGVVTRAVAPVLPDGRPVFWVRVPPPPKKAPDLTDPSVTWACRFQLNNSVPALPDVRSLKKPDLPLMRVFMHRIRMDSSLTIRQPHRWSAVLTADDRANLYNRADTVVTFDPESYEEKVYIVRSEINPDDLDLGVVQDWYWDDRAQALTTRFFAVAPLRKVYDGEGNFLFVAPFFYRKNE